MIDPEAPHGWWEKVWHAGAVSVLVVTESWAWSEEVRLGLEAEGYAVRVDEHGGLVDEPGCPYDVILVDLALSGRPAAAVCRAVRTRSSIPILGVASRSVRERVLLDAYAAGIDQWVSSSVRPHEITARVRALLRRSPPRPRRLPGGAVVADDLALDMARCVVTVAGRDVVLTRAECEILYLLMRHPGRVVRRADLTGDGPRRAADHALDALVRRVRTKLEAVEGRRRIVAVRGVGFRLELRPAPDGAPVAPLATTCSRRA